MENRTTNENGNSTRLQNRYLDTVYDTIMQYHENTSQYNSNMQNIIRILEETQHTYFASSHHRHRVNIPHGPAVRSTPGRGAPTPSRGPMRGHSSNISQPRSAGGGPIRGHSWNIPQPRAAGGGIRNQIPPILNSNGLNNNSLLNDNSLLFTYMFQPGGGETPVVPLTSNEIDRHTTTYGCSAEIFGDISGNQCPISLDPFQIGDVIMKITGCGHTFKRRPLMRWFERSNSCPVCRYNLRETHVDNSNNSVPLVDNSNNTFDISNNIMNELNNTLNDSFNMMIQTLANELQTNSQHLLDISMNLPINLNTNNEQHTNGETTQEVSVQDVESDSDDEIEPDLSVD